MTAIMKMSATEAVTSIDALVPGDNPGVDLYEDLLTVEGASDNVQGRFIEVGMHAQQRHPGNPKGAANSFEAECFEMDEAWSRSRFDEENIPRYETGKKKGLVKVYPLFERIGRKTAGDTLRSTKSFIKGCIEDGIDLADEQGQPKSKKTLQDERKAARKADKATGEAGDGETGDSEAADAAEATDWEVAREAVVLLSRVFDKLADEDQTVIRDELFAIVGPNY